MLLEDFAKDNKIVKEIIQNTRKEDSSVSKSDALCDNIIRTGGAQTTIAGSSHNKKSETEKMNTNFIRTMGAQTTIDSFVIKKPKTSGLIDKKDEKDKYMASTYEKIRRKKFYCGDKTLNDRIFHGMKAAQYWESGVE